MNIVLIGPRGSGKSTVARLLADRLDLVVLCTDDRVEKQAGKPIAQIVKQSGWEAFRDLEQDQVRMDGARDRAIIDAGGGAIERQANRRALSKNALVVYLTGPPEVLAGRIAGDPNRPALTAKTDAVAEMTAVIARRDGIYRSLASVVIDTSESAPEQTAQTIAVAYLKAARIEDETT